MRVENEVFEDEHVPIDGHLFLGCKFERCALVCTDVPPEGFENCSFVDSGITFAGSAGNVMAFFVQMFNSPLRNMVEPLLHKRPVGG